MFNSLRCERFGQRKEFSVSKLSTSAVEAPAPQDFAEIFRLDRRYRISQAIYVVAELGIPICSPADADCNELAAETNTHAPTLYEFSASSPEPACSTKIGPRTSS